jgi:hypothetical protein
MGTMRLAIVDQTQHVTHTDVRRAVRAINRQLREDFFPIWHIKANCRVVASATSLETVRDEAVIFLRDSTRDQDYLGYHDRVVETGLPYGFVFLDIAQQLDEPWTVTLSHEVLELIGNRHCNYYALGPHPKQRSRTVAHWFELCDAVQDNVYLIDRVEVSDFLLPLYFTPQKEIREKCSFLGAKIHSFGVDRGGYVGYWDPRTGEESNYFADKRARERFKVKGRVGEVRRRQRVSKLIARF